MNVQDNKLSTAEEGPYWPCEIVVTVNQSLTGADQPDVNDSFLFPVEEEGPSIPDELVTGTHIPQPPVL